MHHCGFYGTGSEFATAGHLFWFWIPLGLNWIQSLVFSLQIWKTTNECYKCSCKYWALKETVYGKADRICTLVYLICCEGIELKDPFLLGWILCFGILPASVALKSGPLSYTHNCFISFISKLSLLLVNKK